MRKRNKLYTANKWNQPLFMPDDRENNLFALGGYGPNQFSITKAPTTVSKTSGYFNTNSGLNIKTPTLTQPTTSYTNWGNYGQAASAVGNSNSLVNNFSTEATANNPFKQYTHSGSSNSEEGSNSASTWAQIGGAAASALGRNMGGYRNGAFDAFDPVYHLSGGKSSDVGDSLSDAGVSVFQSSAASGNPWGMLAGAALKVGGGLVNTFWGTKWNKELIARVENQTDAMKQGADYVASASTNDDFLNKASNINFTKYNFSNDDVGVDGVWTHKGRDKANSLRNYQDAAFNYLGHAMATGAERVDKKMDDQVLAANTTYNKAAYGGLLNTANDNNNNMGAIDYGFMSDYLTAKKRTAEVKDKVNNNIFGSLASPSLSTFALGGDMQANGSDFGNGLSHIDAGGSHESNPYEGVQMGISRENNQPNLVEEGETVFDDYVFSRRIKLDAQTKKKFHVSRKSDITFADLSKRLEKESLERPNDPISLASLKKQMHALAEEQERQKEEQRSQEMQDAFAQLPPEQQQAIMQQVAMEEQQAAQAQQEQQAQQLSAEQQEQLAQQQPDAQQVIDTNMQQQQPQMEEVQMAACGGKLNKFDDGGNMKTQIYAALSPYAEGGIHTDADFEKWRIAQKLDEVKDWDSIAKNEALIAALRNISPSLDNALANGYDFGAYKASDASPYDLTTFNDVLNKYTASKHKGNKEGNYVIDDKFNLGKYKTIKELEDSPEYKAYTDYMKGVLGRTKGIGFSYSPNGDNDYKSIVWDDPNKTFSEGDYNALQTLTAHAKGTATNPKGDIVPLWTHSHDKEGKSHYTFNDNADELFERYRTDGKGGIFHLTPDVIQRGKQVKNLEVDADGNIQEIIGDVPKGWTNVGNYSWQTSDKDNIYNYYRRPGVGAANTAAAKNNVYEPIHQPTWGRYVGLMGPLVGLGMQTAGVGKPDYTNIDKALTIANGPTAYAAYKPIYHYLKYTPMDIWQEQNRMNANTRASDKAILNNSSPIGTQMAGLVANNYNAQNASGGLYRQALEYNDALRLKKGEFDRATDTFNADAFNKNSVTNAEIFNNNKRTRAQMTMENALQKMNADASWYKGIYGNVNNFFQGLGAWGKENQQSNMIYDMAADGIFGTMSDQQSIAKDKIRRRGTRAAKGGRINRRKGLTF